MDFKPWVLLSQWLPAWQKAKIASIPVYKIGEFSITEYLGWGGDINRELPWTLSNCGLDVDALPSGEGMIRWDICAPSAIKAAMSRGLMTLTEFMELREEGGDPILPEMKGYYEARLWQRADRPPPKLCFREMMIEDDRLWELIRYDINILGENSNLKVFWRPWITPLIYERYPVEFRVFVENGQVIGVSNYYFRRALPANYLPLARHVARETEKLMPYAVEHFTADWMFKDNTDCVLLECGPPHYACDRYWSVDPCGFPRGDTNGIIMDAKGERFPLES